MPLFTNEDVVSGSVDANITNPSIAVTGPLTDAQLRATPVDINGTFTPSGTQDVNIVGTTVTQPVSGTVTIANPGLTDTQLRATAVPVSGPLTDAQLRATPVPVSTTAATATNSTVTLVVSSATSITLLAANAARKKAILFFEGATQNVKLGATASASSYTYKVAANSTLIEIPSEWTGRIDCQGTAGKNILVTELF